MALLKFSNEYIVRLHDKVDKRDGYIDKLREEVKRLRVGADEQEVRGEDGEDLLEIDMLEGEEEDFGDPPEGDEEDEKEDAVDDNEEEEEAGGGGGGDEDMEYVDEDVDDSVGTRPRRMKSISGKGGGGRRA